MQDASEDRPGPWEIWCSAPWYEQLGMTLFLGSHVYLFIRVLIG
jgi:hypothetical protein